MEELSFCNDFFLLVSAMTYSEFTRKHLSHILYNSPQQGGLVYCDSYQCGTHGISYSYKKVTLMINNMLKLHENGSY